MLRALWLGDTRSVRLHDTDRSLQRDRGSIPVAGITPPQAAEMARAHCVKYGRSSRILAIRSAAGEKTAVFECI